ncbi:hypothetical protein WUBG_07675, partial [Wuchereria bancrofti]
MGSGLFSASQHPETFFEHQTLFFTITVIGFLNQDKAVSKTRKEQNLATLLSLKEKAQKLREEAMKNKHFFCGTSTDEMLNLFKPVHELPSATQTFSAEKSILTDLPYYMIVRLNRKKKCDKALDTVRSSSATTEDVIANQTRQEFWFAIPKHKVDAIYHFLLQWNPEKYGSSIKKSVDQQEVCEVFEDCGFVVLDSETSQKFA